MSTNDITGDELRTKSSNSNYRDGWDAVFSQKTKKPDPVEKVLLLGSVTLNIGSSADSKSLRYQGWTMAPDATDIKVTYEIAKQTDSTPPGMMTWQFKVIAVYSDGPSKRPADAIVFVPMTAEKFDNIHRLAGGNIERPAPLTKSPRITLAQLRTLLPDPIPISPEEKEQRDRLGANMLCTCAKCGEFLTVGEEEAGGCSTCWGNIQRATAASPAEVEWMNRLHETACPGCSGPFTVGEFGALGVCSTCWGNQENAG